jgi:hypothetical protein
LNFSDSTVHQVAFYFVDWDSNGRNLRVQVLDANNILLDTQNLTSFVNGAYLVWKLSGHVKLQVTNLGGGNPVLSGIFFGGATSNTVTVAPSSVTLSGGQSQTFTATVSGTGNQAVTWSLSAGAVGSISQAGVYTALSTISSMQTLSVIATSAADGITTGSASVTLTPPASGGTISFVQTDLTTKGNWKSVYGSEGYNVIQDTSSYPSYVTVTPGNVSTYTWQASTTDVRALQKGSSSTDRIAACWYSSASQSFTVDLSFSDTATHQVAFYFVDWDAAGRNVRVQILDASNNVLDTQNLTTFVNGSYLVWKLSGHVKLQVINLAGVNPVLSGIFFGGTTGNTVTVAPSSVTLSGGQTQTFTATVNGTSNQSVTWSLSAGAAGSISQAGVYTAPSTISSVQTLSVIATSAADGITTGSASVTLTPTGSGGSISFVQTDLTTQGNWKTVYGSQGYNVIQDTASYPSYVTVTPGNVYTYTWAASTSDVRGLQKAASGTDRIAGCWYTPNASFTVDLNFSDTVQHQVAFYFVDWDSGGRSVQAQILDAGNNVLDTQNLTSFVNGAYLVWKLSGHVKLQVANVGGVNPVLSGIFFQ